jgi:cell wall-associated NlpC family hydrolase
LDQSKLILSGETDNKEALGAMMSDLQKLKNIKINNKIVSLPEAALGDKTFGVISVSVANMRKDPDHDKEMASQALLGSKVKLLKLKDGFYLAQTPDNYLGWIEDGSLIPCNKDFIDQWEKSKKVIFADLFGLMYSKPDENSDPIGDYVIASVVKSEGTENGWVKIKTPRDVSGYAKEKSVMDFDEWTKSRKPTAENIIKDAHRFLGFPYLWGGYSSKGLDCSGFMKTVFWLNGIMLPRDANQQGLVGNEIIPGKDYENIIPGDLLFFGSKRDGKPHITHVGLYIGNKQFIHSSVYIQISSFEKGSPLFDSYHGDHLVKIMRVLKQ